MFSYSDGIAAGRPNRYDSGMAGEIAVRRLSPEFWAIVGSAVTLLMAFLGIAALVLTIAGWLRDDIRSVDARVDGLETRLSVEIKALDANLSGEIRSLDAKVAKLDAKVAKIDKRLAVVESHVLGKRPLVEGEPSDETQTL